jgi:endothelin-converting enzyme
LSNLDPNYEDIDPCTDFDKFMCGGWEETHDLRPDQGDIFTGTLMVERSQMLLRHILESVSSVKTLDSSADQDNFNKLKSSYEACMNENVIKQYGAKPLRSVIKKIQEVFPATTARKRKVDVIFPTFHNHEQKGIAFDGGNELTNALLYLMNIGASGLVNMGVSGGDRDPDSQAIFINPLRRVGLPSNEYYNDTETVSAYKDTIIQVLPAFIDLGGPPNATVFARGNHMAYVHLANLVQNLVEFEKKLADASPPPEEQEDVTKYYNPRTLDETRALLPQVSFSYIISTMAPKEFSTNRIILGSPSYMAALSEILSKTPKDTVQAYMIWKTIQAYVSKVQDPVLKPLTRFNNRLQGKDPDATEERWRTCIRLADDGLGWILSRFFVEKAFSPEAKEFGDLIVSDIKDRFMVTLNNTEWMSPEVRDKGIEKVKNIVQKIGYPTKSPDITNPEGLRAYYEAVEITNHTFFENALQIQKFYAEKEWSALGKPTDRDEWLMTAPTVNAYYNPPGNEIVFPAGIMQSPVFFDPTVPQYLSYGAFGAVSGHELSHGMFPTLTSNNTNYPQFI